MAQEPFEQLFREAKHSAFHLEMRDGYALNEDYQAWISGERFDVAERWASWIALIAEGVARGVDVRRARIVSEPVSSYIRYEYDVTPENNIRAGEAVRWLPRRDASLLALPGNDFWLFDGTTVLWNHFDGDGNSAGKELVTDPEAAKLCATSFEAVWERAIPHEDYRVS
ncbi:DUF6879 family protein [Streptomyces sp. PT12]|uniref:DUF6879 family protein n=1 Tax=Streptomyces sp. PT12 TaxID=1510197 RepID=UPI000DE531B4|nr:DUF6879 family protein [Streptomyces sp. PT12]RBM18960.1 hypothetical protein DEH69_11025 [Streptomyces sp. PT12]